MRLLLDVHLPRTRRRCSDGHGRGERPPVAPSVNAPSMRVAGRIIGVRVGRHAPSAAHARAAPIGVQSGGGGGACERLTRAAPLGRHAHDRSRTRAIGPHARVAPSQRAEWQGARRRVRPPRASLAAHTRAAMIGVRSGSGARRCVRPLARSAPTGRDAPRPRACRSEPACGAAGRAERANASHERLFSAATRTIGHARAQSPPTRVRLRASVRSGGARAERAAASRERLRSAATRAIGRARTVGRARARGPRAQAAVIGVRSGGARASTSSQHPSPLRARGRTVQRST